MIDQESQALLLFTNRLLLDVLSIAVDSGKIERDLLDRVINFSASEVVRGAPALKEHVELFVSLTKSRLPEAP